MDKYCRRIHYNYSLLQSPPYVKYLLPPIVPTLPRTWPVHRKRKRAWEREREPQRMRYRTRKRVPRKWMSRHIQQRRRKKSLTVVDCPIL